MEGDIQVIVVGRSRATVTQLATALRDHPGLCVNERVVTNGHMDPLHGVTTPPRILVLVASEFWQEELQAIGARPAEDRPALILIGESVDADMMRLAMQAGARDFFAMPVVTSDVLAAIERISEDVGTQRESRNGVLTAVIGAKGGSGTTFLASNLAHILAARDHHRTALIDMDLQFGAIPLYFDLAPRQSLFDALTSVEHLDIAALKGFATPHKSGLHIFSSTPEAFHFATDIPAVNLEHFIDLSLKAYERVVVDLPRQIDPLTAKILEKASLIILVVEQSVAHIRDAKRLMRIITRELGVSEKGIRIVVNRLNQKSTVGVNDIREALKEPLTVQNDFKRVSESVNLGAPIYELYPRSAVARAVSSLADMLREGSGQTRRSIFGTTLSHLFGR